VTSLPASTVFLLSPAQCGGRRASYLLRTGSTLPLAVRLGEGSLSLGEAFAFMSGLYFRGKLAYARRFGWREDEAPSVFVITPSRGLQIPEMPLTSSVIREFASLDLAGDEPRYRDPLLADAERLVESLPARTRVVLLGSIATAKYVDILRHVFADRLHFPSAFVGRGDMSRGALMLTSAETGVELEYTVVSDATPRHGSRPPRMVKRQL
jgi:hypothetical protein